MKSNSFLVLLVSSVMLIAIASALVTPAAAEDPIIVGKWDRTDGDDKYTIYANRTTKTVLPGGTYYGTWDYDGPGGYKYIFHWEHSPPGREPFIDYVTVAADGQSYSGYNNYGNQFHCVRVSDSAGSGGFPIFYVAVGGGIAAVAVVCAAVYYFYLARGGAAAALSSNVVHREVAQSTSNAVDKPQDPKVEKDKYNAQIKNGDLSTSEKNNTKSKAQNQPSREDIDNSRMPLEQPDEPPDEPPDERTG